MMQKFLEALEQLGYDVAQVCKNGHLINEIALLSPP